MQVQRLSLPMALLSTPLSSNYPLLPITQLFLSNSNFPSGPLISKTISISPTTLPKLMSGVSAKQGYSDGDDGDFDYDDGFYMRKCVEIARKAIGCTSPNPLVGCVIVKDGKIVGQGFHPKAGQPHAEVFALRDVGDSAENATAYVSLEPCNHFGRTPPCTEALIKAKVKRVVIGMVDPNPLVASKGVERLRNAGIEVTVGIEEELCKSLNEPFIHLMLTGKPFVTLRYSLSVNGQIVDQLGEGSTESGGYYSQLLQEYDAVIVSSASITDKLSIPQSQEPGANQPLWIITTSNNNNNTSLDKIFDLPIKEASTKVVVFSNQEIVVNPKIVKREIETVVLNQISLNAILEYSKRQGFCSVLLDLRGNVDDINELVKEGIEQNLLQKVVIHVLPQWVEKDGENSCVAALSNLDKSLDIKKLKPKISGKSVLLEGYF